MFFNHITSARIFKACKLYAKLLFESFRSPMNPFRWSIEFKLAPLSDKLETISVFLNIFKQNF